MSDEAGHGALITTSILNAVKRMKVPALEVLSHLHPAAKVGLKVVEAGWGTFKSELDKERADRIMGVLGYAVLHASNGNEDKFQDEFDRLTGDLSNGDELVLKVIRECDEIFDRTALGRVTKLFCMYRAEGRKPDVFFRTFCNTMRCLRAEQVVYLARMIEAVHEFSMSPKATLKGHSWGHGGFSFHGKRGELSLDLDFGTENGSADFPSRILDSAILDPEGITADSIQDIFYALESQGMNTRVREYMGGPITFGFEPEMLEQLHDIFSDLIPTK